MADKDYLDRLQEKIKSTKANMGGTNFWKPKAGRNVIRIMPPKAANYFFQDQGKHYSPDGKQSWVCPKFTANEECPICELVSMLYKGGEYEKQMADKLKVRKNFLMWIIDRENESRGPQLYAAVTTVIDAIFGYTSDPEWGDPAEPDEGYDLTITKEGEKLNTTYQVRPKSRKSPLTTSIEQFDEWMDKIDDLSTSKHVQLPDLKVLEKALADLTGGDYDLGGGEVEEEAPRPSRGLRTAREALEAPRPELGSRRTVLRR